MKHILALTPLIFWSNYFAMYWFDMHRNSAVGLGIAGVAVTLIVAIAIEEEE